MPLDSILILYSSQTGTAKSIAELFVSDDLNNTIVTNPRLFDLTAYAKHDPDFSLLAKETNPVIFIVATTGQGDFPDNALSFMRVIRRMDKKFPADTAPEALPFAGVTMLNLGLGDSNYDRFNGGIQQIERFLTKLGCKKSLATVFADEGIGLDLGVERWRTQSIEFLKTFKGQGDKIDSSPVIVTEPSLSPDDVLASLSSAIACTETPAAESGDGKEKGTDVASSKDEQAPDNSNTQTAQTTEIQSQTTSETKNQPSDLPESLSTSNASTAGSSIAQGPLESLLVLYSSQTGTAKSIAELFVSDDLNSSLVVTPRLFDLTAYAKHDPDFSLLAKEKNPVVFIIATTGQGDFPDNALPFMRIIRRLDKKYPAGTAPEALPFAGVQMLNLGLGDSNYDRFNGGIQQIERFLTKLGSQKSLATVFADEGIGLDLGVERWRKQTIEFLKGMVMGGQGQGQGQALGVPESVEQNAPSATTQVQAQTQPQPQAQAQAQIIQTQQTVPQTETVLQAASDSKPTTQAATSAQTTIEGESKLESSEPQSETTTTTTTTPPPPSLPFFKTPQTFVNPPAIAAKPEFLMKKHVAKVESFLFERSAFQAEISSLCTAPSSQNPLVETFSGNDLIDYKGIEAVEVQGQENAFKHLFRVAACSGQDNSTLYGSEFLLQQFVSSHNLHSFLNTTPTLANSELHSKITQQLGSIEYGYSNIGTLPLFAKIDQIGLPSRTTTEHSLVKTTIDLTLALQPSTVQVLSNLPVFNESNPTVTTDSFFENGVSPQNDQTGPTGQNSQNGQKILVKSLYRPGDSVSILCPNNYQDVVDTLKFTDTDSYSKHGLILSTIKTGAGESEQSRKIEKSGAEKSNATAGLESNSNISTTLNKSNISITPVVGEIQTPMTHVHCHQPGKDLVNQIISKQNDQNATQNDQNDQNEAQNTQNEAQNAQDQNTHPIPRYLNLNGILYDTENSSISSILPSLESVLSHCVELGSPLKKALLRCFADTCAPLSKSLPESSSEEQYQACVVEILYHLMSKAGFSVCKTEIDAQKITISQLLRLFTSPSSHLPTLRPDINNIIELCNSLKPRSYSISSSPFGSLEQVPQNNQNNQDEKNEQNPNNNTFVAGSRFRFVATHTSDILPTLKPLSTAPFANAQAVPADLGSICNESELNFINNNSPSSSSLSSSPSSPSPSSPSQKSLPATLLPVTGQRKYDGLCTTLFLQLYSDLKALQNANIVSESDFLSFLTSPSSEHNNPRFWGTVISKGSNDFARWDDLDIFLPFFFHTSPTFHPPSLLTPNSVVPSDSQSPTTIGNRDMMLFGPGTGSSPFLSFVQHKFYSNFINSTLRTDSTLSKLIQNSKDNGAVSSLEKFGFPDNKSQNIIDLSQSPLIHSTYPSIHVSQNTTTTLCLEPKQNSTEEAICDNFGKISLFTGNRYRTQDYLHHRHWLDLLNSNSNSSSGSSLSSTVPALDKLYSVFSREGESALQQADLDLNSPMSPVPTPASPEPRHVQDLIQQHSESVAKHVLAGGFVYVCGDGVLMAKQVQKAIEAAVAIHGDKYFNLYSASHDVVVPEAQVGEEKGGNSNPTSHQALYLPDSISQVLLNYVLKDPATIPVGPERDSWARGIVTVMIKSGRYNTDVW